MCSEHDLSFSRLIRLYDSRGLLRAGATLTTLNIFAGVMGYVFQVLMGRWLSAGDFAVLSAMMSLLITACAPVAAATMFLTRRVAELSVSHRERVFVVYQRYVQWCGGLVVAVTPVFAAGAIWLQEYLNSPDVVSVWLFGGATVAAVMTAINSAVLQGLHLFRWLGVLAVVAVVIKILLGIALVAGLGWQLHGALGALLFSTIAVAAVGFYLIAASSPRSTIPVMSGSSHRVSVSSIISVILAGFAQSAITQLDVVMVNHYFQPPEAAEFAAVAVFGKAILFLPAGIGTALFPMIARNRDCNRTASRLLLQAVIAACGGAVAAAGVYMVAGESLMTLLFAGKYAGAGPVVGIYAFAMLPMAIVMVLQQFLFARGRWIFGWCLTGAAIAQSVVINAWHPDTLAVISVIACCGCILLLVGSILAYWECRASPREP